jgi:peptidoglycan/xylan/chitin deacetylase (PgdA/CDA1 family)
MGDSTLRHWRTSSILVASAGLHGAALAAMLTFPASWKVMLAALIGNHALLGTVGLFPRNSWLGPNITRLPPAAARGGVVALTFDDGPDPEVTPKVLDLLKQTGNRATFFCVGRRAEAHADLVADLRAAGHGVENHTFSHPHTFAFRGTRGLRLEIERAQKAIERSGGGRPAFFRAPAGIQNPLLSPVLAGLGLSLVSWTRRGFDTVTSDGSRVAGRLGRNLRGGDILLLHDASSARKSGRPPVVLDALPRVLDEMGRKGLRSEALQTALGVNWNEWPGTRSGYRP